MLFFKKVKKEDVNLDASEKIMRDARKKLCADLEDLQRAIKEHQTVLKKAMAK